MTNQQGAPEALRLAGILDGSFSGQITFHQVAHELRRLAALVEAQQSAISVPITVDQVEDAIGLQSTAWDTSGAVNIVEAVLRLANAQQPAAHVQNPAGIEHVAGDVSKNDGESNMARQAAPSAAGDVFDEPDEVIKLRALAATCYAGLGAECNLPENWLDALNAAANGEPFTTSGLLPYKAQPSPTPQADSQPAPVNTRQIAECYRVALIHGADHSDFENKPGAYWSSPTQPAQADSPPLPALEIRAPNKQGEASCIVRWEVETPAGWVGAWSKEALEFLLDRPQAADSVLEDAALLQEARTALWQPANVDLCERIDAYLDAARKQGGA